jgi:CRISPR-associated helicase Cas3/CRISPR-associated endonuclease Cas3-HD
MIFFAHSENAYGIKESVSDHACETAKLASFFGSALGIEKMAKVCGTIHDCKNSQSFQDVLNRKKIHVDHASPGAYFAFKCYKEKGLLIAIAICGHHDGLGSGDKGTISNLFKALKRGDEYNNGMEYSLTGDETICNAYSELLDDLEKLPDELEIDWIELLKTNNIFALMLYQRILFSVLVDADYSATAAHFSRKTQEYIYEDERYISNKMVSMLINQLDIYRDFVKKSSTASEELNNIRNKLYDYCLEAAPKPKGAFTLTAPTGTGKTLAMLAFALEHMRCNGHKRIIVVLPYLNLIDQTVKTYREVFGDNGIVYEDHSLAHENRTSESSFFVETWNSPIIITTTVRFFETLFESRAPDCRKLHRIADAVILFDEAQSMPPPLAAPTLGTLAYLCRRFGSTVVFSTATQPAFEFMKSYSGELEKWNPEEIVTDSSGFYNLCRRVNVDWRLDRQTSFAEIASEVAQVNQCCVIVNIKRHALELFNQLEGKKVGAIFHISTNMCPAHRINVIDKIKYCLNNNLPCHVVSTSCIEAGVDLDFPVLYRSIAPLDAVIQAAGRCNRKGNPEKGKVIIFIPENDGISEYPSNTYREFTDNLRIMLSENNNSLDIHSAEVIKDYFRSCFLNKECKKKLRDAIEILDYRETSEQYRWIEDRPDVSIIVPYEAEINLFQRLTTEAREKGIDGKWIAEARKISVNVSLNKKANLVDVLENVKFIQRKNKKGEKSGWYILLDNQNKVYTQDYGLDFSKEYFRNPVV